MGKNLERIFEQNSVLLNVLLTILRHSGFDRGHLAAAGNHRASLEDCQETFYYSDMAPQVGEGFNRGAWNQLEKLVTTKNH